MGSVKDFPRTIEDITPLWLSNVLNSKILLFDKKVISSHETAMVIMLYNIKYLENKHCHDSSFVVKMHNHQKIHTQEIYFYKYIQPQIKNINTPKIYGIWEDDNLDFFILMEDLKLRWQPFYKEFYHKHTHEIIQEIYKFHEVTSKLDLSHFSEDTIEDHRTAMKDVENIFPKFIEKYPDIGHPAYTRWCQFWQNLINNNQLIELFDKIQDIFSTKQQSLLHFDLHSGNVWWREKDYVFFDFELVRKGPIGIDLICFFCSCPREIDYYELVKSISSEPETVLNVTLLYSIIYTTVLMDYMLNQQTTKILIILDLFDKFDVEFLVKIILK
jgi:hypothetical protein